MEWRACRACRSGRSTVESTVGIHRWTGHRECALESPDRLRDYFVFRAGRGAAAGRPAGGPVAPLRSLLSIHRARRQSCHLGIGRAGQPARHVCRRGVGRAFQDGGRRGELASDLRRPGGVVGFGARDGAVGLQPDLGRDRRDVPDPPGPRDGRRHLQVDGRRGDLGEDGARGHGPHRTCSRAPDESRHRVRVRARPYVRSSAGSRCVPHDGRRRELGAGPACQ